MPTYNEAELDKIIRNKDAERKVVSNVGDSAWGQLIIPGKDENPEKTSQGLKLILMASYKLGFLLVRTLIEFEKKFPNKLNIVGLITDDPVSPNARISLKRRIWRLFDGEERLDIEDAIVEEALCSGIPVYTGAVKTDYARALVRSWNPDAIQVCVFGQIIDKPIIEFPKLGIYNYHPADLAHHVGAGPRPFQDLIDRDANTSRFTIHQLTEQLDSGQVLGQSPVINVRNKDGSISHNLLVLEDKMTETLDYMAIILTEQLIKFKSASLYHKIDKLNFASYFTKIQREQLLVPITTYKPDNGMPNISRFSMELLNKIK